jgi:hypothetical protein
MSQYEIVQINDTLAVANGTIVFNKLTKFPWRVELHVQKYDRGEWLLQVKKTYNDICSELRNPLSPAFYLSQHLPSCPIAAGVSFKN